MLRKIFDKKEANRSHKVGELVDENPDVFTVTTDPKICFILRVLFISTLSSSVVITKEFY